MITQQQRGSFNHTVWMIIPSYFPAIGGAEIQVSLLSRTLCRDGVDVRILTRKLNKGTESETTDGGVPVIRLPSLGITPIDSFIFLCTGLWYLFWHGRRGIYHAHAVGSAGWLAVLAGRWFGGHSLIKLRTNFDVYERIYSHGLAGWQFHRLLFEADRLLIVNRELESWLLGQGYSREKVIYLPNTVDSDEFFPLLQEQKQIKRDTLGLPQEKTVILYVGRLSYVKGVDVLLKAWSALPESCRKNALLLIIGHGPEFQSLQQMALDLRVDTSVSFLGLVSEPREYYQAADIFALPSRAEGLSNALLEAMACGMPCVSSAVGGVLDLITDKENGLLFESEDYSQFASCLADLIRGTLDRDRMGRQAQHTILKKLDAKTTIRHLCNIYEQLSEQVGIS